MWTCTKKKPINSLTTPHITNQSLKDQSLKHNRKVKAEVTKLITSSSLSDRAKVLTLDPSDLGNPRFYMLPKIHKIKDPSDLVPGRPIVSAISCPTELISQFLDSVFQQIVRTLPTYVKDTNHALILLEELHFTSSCHRFIFTMDVTALYTSIPHTDGLQAIRHFVERYPITGADSNAIVRLTQLVLDLNTFEFDGHYFEQISGVAMGTKMGPSYANLFMGYLEEKFLKNFPDQSPEFFKRYIDDCVGVTSMPRPELDLFIGRMNSLHTSINFTSVISTSDISFLDIKATLTHTGVRTSVHYKPTDSHAFLLYQSSHPRKCRDSIPYSQLLRLRRLCQDDHDFIDRSNEMLDFFRARNYPEDVLHRAVSAISGVCRQSTLQTGSRNNQTTRSRSTRPILVLTSHPHNNTARNILLQNFSILQHDVTTGPAFPQPPLVAYRRDRNLKDLLVRSRLSTPVPPDQPVAIPCDRPCLTCPFLNPSKSISFPTLDWRIVDSFSCTDRNVVYAIRCKRCTMCYIGETGLMLADRFASHLRDILKNEDKPVARHFNSDGHGGKEDIEVSVLRSCSSSKRHRRSLESRLISRLGTLYPKGINARLDLI